MATKLVQIQVKKENISTTPEGLSEYPLRVGEPVFIQSTNDLYLGDGHSSFSDLIPINA